jgi:hypothetical protein
VATRLSRQLSSFLAALALPFASHAAATVATATASSPALFHAKALVVQEPLASANHSEFLDLAGADARIQLLVTATGEDGAVRDYTRAATY